MKYAHDDGGRSAAGFKGNTGDCVCRSIAIATQIPYLDVYAMLNESSQRERRVRGKSSARTGVHKATYRRVLESLGWKFTPTMAIGSGCRVHLTDGELPMGRLIVVVSKHLCAVIDGVIHDTYNPSERGATIYSPNSLENIPAGAKRREDGFWVYRPQRCVYGYFTKGTP